MFELSFIDLALLVGGGAVLLGKRELPVVARYCGRGTGKLVALLNTVRDTVQNQSEKHGLKQFQNEVRKNLHQLNTVRSDLQFAGRSHPYHQFQRQNDMEGNLSPYKTKTLESVVPSPSKPQSLQASSTKLKESVNNNSSNSNNPKKKSFEISKNEASIMIHSADIHTSKPVNKSYLGKLALAEIVLNEKEKETRGRGENINPEKSGSDLVNNVIVESLLNDQLDKLQKGH